MPKCLYFLFKTLFFGGAALIIIPKEFYKKFFLYGFIFGALGDVLFITIFSGIFHLFKYQNLGFFSVFGLFAFWTPIAWMFTFMIFLFLLPRRKGFLYPYILGFAVFGYMVGMVLHNLGLLDYTVTYKFIAPLIFTGWFSLAAWFYIKNEKIELLKGF